MLAEKFNKIIRASSGFDRVLQNVKILTAVNGKCRAEMTVAVEHTNLFGTMHGGISATLVDVISTCALMTNDRCPFPRGNVSIQMNIEYLKSANVNDDVIIEAETVKVGKTLAFLAVKMTDKATGALLVKGTHTKFILT